MSVTRVTVDLRRNVLRLHLDNSGTSTDAPPPGEHLGVLDVGANGWLLGVQVGEAYYAVADAIPGTDHLVRSTEARLIVLPNDLAIVIPRRGPGYELSFPSGNQCWLRSPARPGADPIQLCSVIAGSR
ncbi:MAG TPA: hypothetical protein VGR08_10635 [Thermomicrobiales bacterium]|nr:hypothetical protein [Thermomicrobiales bacterium]